MWGAPKMRRWTCVGFILIILMLSACSKIKSFVFGAKGPSFSDHFDNLDKQLTLPGCDFELVEQNHGTPQSEWKVTAVKCNETSADAHATLINSIKGFIDLANAAQNDPSYTPEERKFLATKAELVKT